MPRKVTRNFQTALRFNGSSNYVISTGSVAFSGGTGATIGGWILPTKFQTGSPFISNIIGREGGTGTLQMRFGDIGVAPNQIQAGITLSSGTPNLLSNTRFVAGTAYHVMLTYNGSTLALYVNGVLDNSSAQTGTVNVTGTFPIGINTNFDASRYFNGTMDGMVAYNRGLSAVEVSGIYYGDVVPTNGQLLHYKFDEGSGTTAIDSSGSANNGTLVNSPAYVASPFFQPRTLATTRAVVQDFKASLKYDGTTSKLLLNQTVNLPLYRLTVYAVFGRFKVGGSAAAPLYVDSGNTGADFLYASISTASKFRIKVQKALGTVVDVSTSNTITRNVWHTFFFSDNNGTVQVYIDGVLDATNFNYTAVSANAMTKSEIGSHSDVGIFSLGSHCDYQLFSYVPTTAQIALIHNGLLKGNVGSYSLGEGAGTTAYDSSGNANNGTITAGTYTSDVPSQKRQLLGGNMVPNGDFEYSPPTTTILTSGFSWIASPLFRWGTLSAGNNTAFEAAFDNTTKFSGTGSLRLSTTNTTGTVNVSTFLNTVLSTSDIPYYIPVLPNTSYTGTAMVKTNNVASGGVKIDFREITGTPGLSTSNITSTLSGTNNWTLLSITFTTGAGTRYLAPILRNNVAGNVSDAWFDNVTLTPTVNTTRGLAI